MENFWLKGANGMYTGAARGKRHSFLVSFLSFIYLFLKMNKNVTLPSSYARNALASTFKLINNEVGGSATSKQKSNCCTGDILWDKMSSSSDLVRLSIHLAFPSGCPLNSILCDTFPTHNAYVSFFLF